LFVEVESSDDCGDSGFVSGVVDGGDSVEFALVIEFGKEDLNEHLTTATVASEKLTEEVTEDMGWDFGVEVGCVVFGKVGEGTDKFI
jgi:hypothetical protein